MIQDTATECWTVTLATPAEKGAAKLLYLRQSMGADIFGDALEVMHARIKEGKA